MSGALPQEEHPANRLEALPVVEAWRGIAAALVVLAHWGGAAGWRDPLTSFAYVGVDLFFVISGFVFAPYIAGKAEVSWLAFTIRRIMRLWPAYLLALGLYAGLAYWDGRALLYLPEHVLMSHVQSREMAFYYNPAFWSLPAEVQFYAWVCLLGIGASAVWRQRWWAHLLVASLLLRLGLIPAADASSQNAAYLLIHHLPGLLVEFLFGVMAWQWLNGWDWRTPGLGTRPIGADETAQQARGLRTGLIVGCVGMVVCTLAYAAVSSGTAGASWLHGQLSLAMAGCFAPVLAATANWRPRPTLVRATFTWAGRLSYPVYLLHSALTPMASGTGARAWADTSSLGWMASVPAVPALLALLVSAVALHLLVEEPSRRIGRQWAQRVEETPSRRGSKGDGPAI